MKTYLDELRPNERRLVVGVAVMAFVVLNFWFVVPHFSDWESVTARRYKAEEQLESYKSEIAQKKNYDDLIKQLSSDAYQVPAEEQSLHFAQETQNKASLCGITPTSLVRGTEKTNSLFFVEKSITVVATAREQQLVDFLYNLGASNSMIRVRDLSLHPDARREQLTAQVKLVASYQKASPVKTPAPASKAAPSFLRTKSTASTAPKRPNTPPKRS